MPALRPRRPPRARAAAARAFSTAWPFASTWARKSARAASAAGPVLAISPRPRRATRRPTRRSRPAAGRAGRLEAQDAAADLAPFVLQDAHLDLVEESAVAPDRLARPALDHEADLAIRADRSLVEGEDRQADPVEPQGPEGVLEHERRGFRAVAATPAVVLADRDVEHRRAVVAVELAEGAGSDQPVRLAQVDREGQRAGAGDTRLEEAADLVRAHRAVLVARQVGDLGIGVPARERRHVARGVAPQDDRPPFDRIGKPVAGPHRGERIPSRPCAGGARSPSGSPPRREPRRRRCSLRPTLGRWLRTPSRRPSCSSRGAPLPSPTAAPSAWAGQRSPSRSRAWPASRGRSSALPTIATPTSAGPSATSWPRATPWCAMRRARTRRRLSTSRRLSTRPGSGPTVPSVAAAFAAIEGARGPGREGGHLREAAAGLRPADRDLRRQDPRRRAADRAAGRSRGGGDRRRLRPSAPARWRAP